MELYRLTVIVVPNRGSFLNLSTVRIRNAIHITSLGLRLGCSKSCTPKTGLATIHRCAAQTAAEVACMPPCAMSGTETAPASLPVFARQASLGQRRYPARRDIGLSITIAGCPPSRLGVRGPQRMRTARLHTETVATCAVVLPPFGSNLKLHHA